MREIDLKVLEFIRQYYREHHMTPSHDEISAATGVSRGGTSNKVFKNLSEAGAIVYAADGRRYLPADWREISAEVVGADASAELDRLRALVALYEPDYIAMQQARDKTKKRQQEFRKRLADRRKNKV